MEAYLAIARGKKRTMLLLLLLLLPLCCRSQLHSLPLVPKSECVNGSPLSFGAAVLKRNPLLLPWQSGSRLGMALSATGEMSAKTSRQCFIQLEIHGVEHPKRAFLTILLVRWN